MYHVDSHKSPVLYLVLYLLFQLLVDDLLVYNGTLHAVTQAARGILPTCDGPQQYHTILFSDNKEILRKEKHTIVRYDLTDIVKTIRFLCWTQKFTSQFTLWSFHHNVCIECIRKFLHCKFREYCLLLFLWEHISNGNTILYFYKNIIGCHMVYLQAPLRALQCGLIVFW